MALFGKYAKGFNQPVDSIPGRGWAVIRAGRLGPHDRKRPRRAVRRLRAGGRPLGRGQWERPVQRHRRREDKRFRRSGRNRRDRREQVHQFEHRVSVPDFEYHWARGDLLPRHGKLVCGGGEHARSFGVALGIGSWCIVVFTLRAAGGYLRISPGSHFSG